MTRSLPSCLLLAAMTHAAHAQWVQGGSFGSTNHHQAIAFHQVDTGIVVYGTDNPASGEGGLIMNWSGLQGSGGYIWYEAGCNIEDIDVKVSDGFPYYMAAGHQGYGTALVVRPYPLFINPFNFDSVHVHGSDSYFRAIRMRSDLVTFAGGAVFNDGVIDMSADTGATWTNVATLPGQPVSRLHFVNDDLGFAATGGYRRTFANGVFLPDSGAIYRTTNGGLAWEQVHSDTVAGFSDVHFLDAQTGVATRNDGVIIRSTDGGDTWDPAVVNWPGPYMMTSVTFRPDGTGFASCYRADGSGGYILSSDDGGANWGFNFSTSSLNHSRRIYDLYFFDDAHGYAATHIRPLRTNGIITNVPETNDSSFELFPNPSTDVVTLRLPTATNAQVDVLDATGRLVRSLRMNGSVAEISVDDMLPGSYVVRVTEGGAVRSVRMVRL